MNKHMGGFPEKPGSENNKLFLKKIDQKFVTRHLIILNPKNLILFLELLKINLGETAKFSL